MLCMDAGLHVLCEKLMARTISDCKAMIAKAKEKGLLLSIGHQRHYSMLYAHANEVVQSGVLGDIKHIRALWHRNNSWPIAYSDKEKEAFDLGFDLPAIRDGWYPPIRKQDSAKLTPDQVAALKFLPIKDLDPANGYKPRSGAAEVSYYKDLAELVRWRTSDRTGGGLMAELGSHQLDASSIFLGKVKPIAVSGTGVRSFYGALGSTGYNPRECEDGVFTTYEFPGPTYAQNKDDVVVVTYSSISTNGFEDYGECLMGSRGTMIVEKEANVYLFKEKEPGTSKPSADGGKATGVTVTATKDGKPVAEASSSWGGGGGAAISKGPSGPAWDSDIRGYRTEMEHFAFLIRQQQANKLPGAELYKKGADGKYANAALLPRCHGEIAMADAILALTGNMAMKTRQRIEFEPNWFNPESPDVPETKYQKG
jgi:predicted dehydrogenase